MVWWQKGVVKKVKKVSIFVNKVFEKATQNLKNFEAWSSMKLKFNKM